jgi:hypothetical protein
MSGTAYTSSVSGSTITSGGAWNTTGGGREIPILISTAAIAGTGTAIANAKIIVPKNIRFILLPPFLPLSGSNPRAYTAPGSSHLQGSLDKHLIFGGLPTSVCATCA